MGRLGPPRSRAAQAPSRCHVPSKRRHGCCHLGSWPYLVLETPPSRGRIVKHLRSYGNNKKRRRKGLNKRCKRSCLSRTHACGCLGRGSWCSTPSFRKGSRFVFDFIENKLHHRA